MTHFAQDTAIRETWAEQAVWSQAANRLKVAVERARIIALVLGIAAAALGTAASQTMDGHPGLGRGLAALAAVAAASAPVLAQRGGPARLSDWTRLRAVSEAFKAEAYTYLAGVGAYRGGGDPAAVLRERCHRFRTGSADLAAHTTGIPPENRPLPPVTDGPSYVEHRLLPQLNGYYRPRAELMRRRVRIVERVEFLIGGVGAALAAVAGVYGVEALAAWVAVVASVAVAVAAHATAQRYAYQQLEFTRTAQELAYLLDKWESAVDPEPEFTDAFVAECESVISVQNEAWMIRWTLS
ncbi:DUF4231 domain-containing protein [Streptomyces boninensis]|uniref:DUF4231 domain-containing protein n=1 Tax=Streptomyces boninensis TaxID=2039455 RepID=UPI003B20CD76